MPSQEIDKFLKDIKRRINRFCAKCDDEETGCHSRCVVGVIGETIEANVV